MNSLEMTMAILFKVQNDLTYTFVDMKVYSYNLIAITIQRLNWKKINTIAHLIE